ncbi:MAG TPA: hypothetical protein VG318_12795 [Actinomycetota bacterium]|nr:hypothetical protein [Actinomycetota bacterium]
MGRIEIGTARDRSPSTRPLMSDHNLSARVWATAALLAVPVASRSGLGWWLPVHLVLLGAVSQAIAGGQLMFSATLGLARGPDRRGALVQLGVLNAAALAVVGGRLAGSDALFAAGAGAFVCVIAWVAWHVHAMWRTSVNRRFAITGTFYRLAAASVLLGASIGGAMGIGAFDDAASYAAHRGVHMTLNVFGWAGMTIVGTAITLLPTILHVRSPDLRVMRRAPWAMFGGLIVMSAGATTGLEWLAAAGVACYAGGFGAFVVYVRAVLATERRRKVPTAAFHLVAALAWALVTVSALVVVTARGDYAAARDLVVVGGAGGFAFQALLGAWSFLLPSSRPPVPARRRVELTAMELGGRAQVAAYNAGLVAIAVGLRTGLDTALAGIVCVWLAAAWALTKSWTFPALSRLAVVERRSAEWWAEPGQGAAR